MNYPKAEKRAIKTRVVVWHKRFSDLRVVAYYPSYWQLKPDPTNEAFWSGDLLRALIPLLGHVTYAEAAQGIIEDGGGYFDPLDDTSFDIGWEVCARPKRKIAKWVFGIVSDFVGREDAMDKWFKDGYLDAIFTLRCVSKRFREMCVKYNLPLYSFPYFIVDKQAYIKDKTIDAALIGTRGDGYNWRQKMYPVLKDLSSKYNILIHQASSSKANRIPYLEYIQKLRTIKYFFTGGVDDGDWDTAQIPAKQIEAAGAGACVVTPDLPMNESCGFIDDKTYIKLNDISEIPAILASDRWRRTSKAGQNLVNVRHTVEKRAEQILAVHGGANWGKIV